MAVTEVALPDGRVIVLNDERWGHIIGGHPELVVWRELLSQIIAQPERRRPGLRPDEEWLYGSGGPSRRLKVVVHWEGDRGTVVTAFARRRLP